MTNSSMGADKETIQIELVGPLNEDLKLPTVENEIRKVQIDFKNVSSINSVGIRIWIDWLKSMMDKKIIYTQCPKFIVSQMNTVNGFLPPHGEVKSFYVSYYNEELNIEEHVLYEKGKQFDDQKITVQKEITNSEGVLLELDVNYPQFFKFISGISLNLS